MATAHTVQPGECMATIAHRHGFHDPRHVYQHADNAALRRLRPNPDLLFPGDVVQVPDKAPKHVSAATDQRHTFVVARPQRVLRVRLLDAQGQPRAGVRVAVALDGQDQASATSNAQGVVEVPVGPQQKTATLGLPEGPRTLALAHLRPVAQTPDDGLSGLQARLANLGYLQGEPTGTCDRDTRIALSLFQLDMGLPVDALPNPATVERLVQEHGC